MTTTSPDPAPGDILVVDDTPENITVLRDILVRAGHRVRPALSGMLAQRAVEALPPDLVLLDIMMPGLDGYETCRRLKATASGAEIPVLFISALDAAEDKMKAFHTGAVDYVGKPFRAEEVLARVNVHLRLRQAHHRLAAQNRELAEAARLREDVDAILRHDLKSPLASIISTAEAVGAALPPASAVRTLNDNIRTVSWSMIEMIHRSLDLIKMERGTYVLKAVPLDLSVCLRQVAQELRHTPEGRLVPLVLPPDDTRPVMVVGEPLLCHGLLRNLLQNAIDASFPGGTVTISLRPPSNARIGLALSNRGEIPSSVRPRFAQKFATAGKPGGTGIGAYSARLMAEAQGGSLRLDSSVPGQTTVEVWLPLATPAQCTGSQSPALSAPPPQVATPAADSLRMLIADDDSANTAALNCFIARPGVEIIIAHDGLSAAGLLACGNFDVALIDFEMPGLSGTEVARRHRAHGGTVALLAVTAHDDPARLAAGRESGFDLVLVKPVNRQSLLAALDSVLAVRRPAVASSGLSAPLSDQPADSDLARLAPGFLASRAAPLTELSEALARADAARIHTLAHRLKGGFGLYGFAAATELCVRIEHAAESGDFSAGLAGCHALASEVDRLTRSLSPSA